MSAIDAAVGDLLVERPEGLYCPAGDFHIDPMRPVARAVVTHAHADHARGGHAHVLATPATARLMRVRLGSRMAIQEIRYGELVDHFGVRISLHPAGHVLGSAQVRIEHRGRVWVASGDYFVSRFGEANPTCATFETVRCDVFVSESTFALPVYRWRPQAEVLAAIVQWWQRNASVGRASIVSAYSLGKAQRLLAGLDAGPGPIAVHPAVAAINHAYRECGVRLPAVTELNPEACDPRGLAGSLIVAPPGTLRVEGAATAFASGWMQLRRLRRSGREGFVLSDHSDWPGLLSAITESGARRIVITHGDGAVLARWLREQGLDAGEFRRLRPDGAESDAAENAAENAAAQTA